MTASPPATAPTVRHPPEAIWWLAIALLHVVAVQFLAERLAFAWMYIPLCIAVWLAARRGLFGIDLPLCLAGAACYLLAEPATGFGWAIFLPFAAFIPVIRRASSVRVAFVKGLWTGFIIASGIYGWIWPTAARFLDAGVLRVVPIYMAVSLLIAVQIAAFFALAALLSLRSRLSLPLVIPPVYTVCEYWLSLPMGIPLPLAFAFHPVWIQTLDLAGVAGTTLLIVCCGVAISHMIERILQRDRAGALRGAAVVSGLLILQLSYGALRMGRGDDDAAGLSFRIVQPVSPLRVPNAAVELQNQIADRLVKLSNPPDSTPVDVVVWPEGAASFSPTSPSFNAPYFRAMRESQEATSATIVAHGVDFERQRAGGKLQYRSAIFAVKPSGTISGVYHKRALMPIGEYLPMESTFPILRRMFPEARSIISGDGEFRPLELGETAIAPVICYEVLFPVPVSKLCRAGAGIIVVLTNDRWYGLRQQPPQHMAFAILRAIENRRPVVRGAHSGISAFIESDGRVLPGRSTVVEEVTSLTGIVSPGAQFSVYTRTGDAMVRYLMTPVVAVMLLWGWRRRADPPIESTRSKPGKAGKKAHGR